MIDANDFAKTFAGFVITDCSIRDEASLWFLVQEDYTQWTDWKDEGDYPSDNCLEKRIVYFDLDECEESPFTYVAMMGMGLSRIGITFKQPRQLIMADYGGRIFSVGRDGEYFEETIPYDSGNDARRGAIVKLKTIDDALYLCGTNRIVAVRRGKKSWEWMTPLIPLSEDEREGPGLEIGFEDIDGFSDNDLYAAGARGDVWHYDGATWQKVNFPSSKYFISSVCCAGDGQVYIGVSDGIVYRGRGNTWQQLKDPELSLPFKDMVWYEDRVWCTNDYGVWWIQGDEIVSTDVPDDVYVCSGNLAVRDGVLLLAGLNGAAYLQNGEWNVIFNYADMYKKCEEEGKLEGVLRARWHELAEE